MQRCKAKSKRSGKQCKNYALKNYNVCRMHGARGGPKTSDGYLACKRAPTKHGMYSQESLEKLKALRKMLKKPN
jgi:hypothetical protein